MSGTMFGHYRAPLASRPFRQLFFSQLASELGDFAGRIALAVLITEQTGSAVGAGAVLAVAALPYLGLGQWLTGRAAAYNPRTVLVVADLVRAVMYAAIALDVSPWVRLGLLFVASTASPVFEAVRNGLTPKTVEPALLVDAIGVQTLTNEVTRVFGLAAGGIVAVAASPATAILANAATFVASAVLLVGLPRHLHHGDDARPVRIREGWRALTADPVNRRVLWLFPCLVAFGSVPEALVVPYVDAELPNDPAMSGVLAAMVSVTIVGVVPRLHPSPSHVRRVQQAAMLGAGGAAASAAAFLVPPSIATALFAYACLGLIFSGRVNTGSSVSERLDDRLRASSFSVLDGVISMGQLVAGLGGGLMAELVGVVPTFVGALVLTAAASVAARFVRLAEPLHAGAGAGVGGGGGVGVRRRR